MAFPDSSKKAPNVFFNTYDSTGAPTAPVVGQTVAKVINSLRNVSPTLYDISMSDNISTSGLSVVDGTLASFEYATSTTYPMLITDTFGVNGVTVPVGSLFGTIFDSFTVLPLSVMSMSLESTLAFISVTSYDNIILPCPSIIAGALDTTIQYINYSVAAENITINSMPVISGSLVTTIELINYTNWPTENTTISGLTIHSGNLT